MKTSTRVFILVAAATGAAWGQSAWWLPANAQTGNIYYNGGNVGIGTSTPDAKLRLSSGVLAIGGTNFNPTANGFSISADGSDAFAAIGQSAGHNLNFGWHPSPEWSSAWAYVGTYGYADPLVLGGSTVSLIGSNVGVGTTTPNSAYKLDVQGAIGATDIYVSSNALPDYVFDADYRNAPLNEVAAYIEQNHHLPGMPSAAEAERDRLSVGEMQNKLLQKVEELTLHMISAEKRSDQLTQTNEQLAQQNRELEQQIGELRAQVSAAAPARGK